MKRFIQIALAVAVIATSAWSCNDTKEPSRPKANNSYVLANTNTPIVWAGVQDNEDVYTVLLASATPVSTESPITIQGITVTIPKSALNSEIAVGTAGVSAILNGSAITGAKVKVTITSQKLTVDITNGKVGSDYFDAQYSGAFTNIEGEVIPPDPDELHNQWLYDGTKTDITNSYYADLAAQGNDGYYFVFSNGTTDLESWIYGEQVAFSVYVPYDKVGQDINASGSELYFDNNVSGLWYDDGDVAGGTYKVTFNTTTKAVTIAAEINFNDGKSIKVAYTGTAADLLDVNVPDVPDYDNSLNNQYQYDGGTKVAINWSGFQVFQSGSYNGVMFYLSNAAPVGTSLSDCVYVYVDVARFGQDVALVAESYEDYWEAQFWSSDLGVSFEGYGVDPTDIANGKVKVTKSGSSITVQVVMVFTNGKILQAKYAGTAVDLDGGSGGETGNISSIDELVGTWAVTEYFVQSGTLYNNNHNIAISKVDANTIKIQDLWLEGGAVNATINSSLQMVIPAKSIFTPSFQPGTYDYYLAPMINSTYADNFTVAFPAQNFVKSATSITMTMQTGTLVYNGNNAYNATYCVLAATPGTETILGGFGFATSTKWTKSISGAPAAAPAKSGLTKVPGFMKLQTASDMVTVAPRHHIFKSAVVAHAPVKKVHRR